MATESNSKQSANQSDGTDFTATGFDLRQIILLYVKGVAMGLGDSVPGISGGTIAVITNIYDRLIFSIRAVDQVAIKNLLRGEFAAAWQHINGNFLAILAVGMLSGLLFSANTVLYLLENQFETLMGFFLGLVIAASFLLMPQVSFKRGAHFLGLCFGIGLTVGVGFIEPLRAEPGALYLFVCGAVAISAMILPGLSGAFILILLGAYELMLTALVEFQIVTILVFAAGCGVGLLAFSRLLAWLLRSYHELSYSVIIGMLLGSISVLWPWQTVLSVYVDAEGVEHALQTGLLWPLNYTETTGQDPQLVIVLAGLIAGATVVYLLQRVFAAKK